MSARRSRPCAHHGAQAPSPRPHRGDAARASPGRREAVDGTRGAVAHAAHRRDRASRGQRDEPAYATPASIRPCAWSSGTRPRRSASTSVCSAGSRVYASSKSTSTSSSSALSAWARPTSRTRSDTSRRQHGYSVRFLRADAMLRRLRQSRLDNSRDAEMIALTTVDLLDPRRLRARGDEQGREPRRVPALPRTHRQRFDDRHEQSRHSRVAR